MKSRRLSLFLTFLKIGAFTFGGGYAMIALLEHELIEKKGWICLLYTSPSPRDSH